MESWTRDSGGVNPWKIVPLEAEWPKHSPLSSYHLHRNNGLRSQGEKHYCREGILLPAFVNTGSDFSSVLRNTLKELGKWIGKMPIQNYSAEISGQCVVLAWVKFQEQESELSVLLHSNGDRKFLINGELLYRQTPWKNSGIWFSEPTAFSSFH